MTKSALVPRLPPALPLLALILFCCLFVRSQFYIAATLTGTRPSRLPPPVLASPSPLWHQCANLISSVLPDIGDAARIWLRHAYVGTNPSSPSSPSSDTHDKFQCHCLVPELHAGPQPRLTAVLQSFNHHHNIPNISTSLRRTPLVDEIIISEDGSTDGSLHDWHSALPSPTHFIIRSNNLHELRSYNRAMRIASSRVVLLLQDDDLLPLSDRWLRDALRLFDALPDLGVLGGYVGQTWDHATGRGSEFGDQPSTHAGIRDGNTVPLPFIEPTTSIPFVYSECTWIAPLFIRTSLLRHVGGLELSIAKRGEPGVWQDCVFSYEAWVNGFTVATYNAPLRRGVGGHGSASSVIKLKQRERVYERAVAFANRKYPRKRIHAAVEALNNRTLLPRSK